VSANRVDGWVRWYRDDVEIADYQVVPTDPNYAQWIWGADSADPARWMQWIEIGVQGRWQTHAGAILFDDFTLEGLPEPATAWLLLLGALPLLRRCR
jgi:hypothetical protein